MQEYVSEAIVLTSEPIREADSRFSMLTKDYGKLKALAVSARKITSKLNGHLQPGYITNIRLVERKGLRLVDALKQGVVKADPAKLFFLEQLIPEGAPDEEVWDMLTHGDFAWKDMLKILGWDPARAVCVRCHRTPTLFHTRTQEFFCADCATKAHKNELLSI